MRIDRLQDNIELLYSPAEEIMRRKIETACDETKKFPRYAAFVILVTTSGKVLLAKRNTEPHKGQYSGIGGKLDTNMFAQEAAYIGSVATEEFQNSGYESPLGAAIRELQEEACQNISVLDLTELITTQKLGFVYDSRYNSYCRMYLATVPDDLQFQVSERELQGAPSVITKDTVLRGEVNDLTALFLANSGLIPGLTREMLEFPIEPMMHMAMPIDVLRYLSTNLTQQKRPLTLSHQLSEPGFIIHANT